MEETAGYIASLLGGWSLTVSFGDRECVAWLHNNGLDQGWYETVVPGEIFLDLDRLGYVPTIYHDGGDAAPLVIFHAARLDRLPYVWEPRTGRIYRAGESGDSGPATGGR